MRRTSILPGLLAISFAGMAIGLLNCGSEAGENGAEPFGVDAASNVDGEEEGDATPGQGASDAGASGKDAGRDANGSDAGHTGHDGGPDGSDASDASDAADASDAGADGGADASDASGGTDAGPSIVRVTKSPAGEDGNDSTGVMPSLSDDGRYVAFVSGASNLVAGDTNGFVDPFLYDRQTDVITRFVTGVGGALPNAHSPGIVISVDARFIAFGSPASNFVANDTNNTDDVFLFDRDLGTTTLVSKGQGEPAFGQSGGALAISRDGGRIVFGSAAANLVSSDTNGKIDLFLYERAGATIERISVDSAGAQSNESILTAAISGDGRVAAFDTTASNVVDSDSNGTYDVFVRDLASKVTTRVSVSSAGVQGNDGSQYPSLSADGRYVAFESYAKNLVAGDTNGTLDIFVRDRVAATTTRVSVGAGGVQANDYSTMPKISADGRYVLFRSKASNLVPNDTNGVTDVFLYDTVSATTTRVNVNALGVQTDQTTNAATLSGDGRFVAFASAATNLVAGDVGGAYDVFLRRLP